MNIEILIGSPRKNGNTFTLSKYLNNMLNDGGVCSNISYLYDYEIKPCIDCRACKQKEKICTLKDDAKILFERIEKADAFIIGTPIYWFGPTAKTKLLIDRFRPYFVNKKLSGKKAAVILPAGSGKPDCDLTIEMFKRVFKTLGVKNLGAVTTKAYDVGDAIKNKLAFKNLLALSEKLVRN